MDDEMRAAFARVENWLQLFLVRHEEYAVGMKAGRERRPERRAALLVLAERWRARARLLAAELGIPPA
jgi:hypothetical protein